MCWFRLPHICRHMKILVAVVKEIVKVLQWKVKYVQRTISLLVRSIFIYLFLCVCVCVGGGGGFFMSKFTFSKQSFNESFDLCNRS